MRRTNAEGIALIKHFEGLSLTMYRDVAGHPTIGYGRMSPKLLPGTTITQAQADQMLDDDLKSAECVIHSLVKGALNDNQFSALVSFVFNLGAQNFRKSTLLRMLNAGDVGGAAQQFERWNKATVNGVSTVVAGLVRRREAERALFLKPALEVSV